MPAPSWRMRPARSMSLWVSASAAAGSSRRVGTSDCERRTATRYPSSGGAPPPSVVVGRGRRPCSLPLGDEPVDLLAHRLHDVLLGDLTDDLAVLEDEADPAPARHADVGGTRLTGPVDLAVVERSAEDNERVHTLDFEVVHVALVGHTAHGADADVERPLVHDDLTRLGAPASEWRREPQDGGESRQRRL